MYGCDLHPAQRENAAYSNLPSNRHLEGIRDHDRNRHDEQIGKDSHHGRRHEEGALVDARPAGDGFVEDEPHGTALEEVGEQDGDAQQGGEPQRAPAEVVDDAGARVEAEEEDEDGDFDEREDGVVEELVGVVPLKTVLSMCMTLRGGFAYDLPFFHIVVFRDFPDVDSDVVGFDV